MFSADVGLPHFYRFKIINPSRPYLYLITFAIKKDLCKKLLVFSQYKINQTKIKKTTEYSVCYFSMGLKPFS